MAIHLKWYYTTLFRKINRKVLLRTSGMCTVGLDKPLPCVLSYNTPSWERQLNRLIWLMQTKPVTYTNQNEHQRGEGHPAGAVVYVTGFFICSGNKNLKKTQEKSSVLGIESCSRRWEENSEWRQIAVILTIWKHDDGILPSVYFSLDMTAKVPSPFNPSAEMTADLPSRLCGITSDATILFRDLSMALPMMP